MSSVLETTDERRSQRGEPAWEVARLFPTQGDWTEADYDVLESWAEGFIELHDGFLEFPPMVDFVHQFNFEFLYRALLNHLETTRTPGRVIPPPFPIKLADDTIREPDIVYVLPHRIVDLRKKPEGADLVMEIVSPGSEARKRDFEEKRADYAQAGISEYWIIDPLKKAVHVLTLDGAPAAGEYREHGAFGSGATATSLLLSGFEIEVDALFTAGEDPAPKWSKSPL